MKATEEKIREIISKEKLVKDVSKLNTVDLLSKQGIDSLDLSNIYLIIEEEFEVDIPDEVIEHVGSIEKLVKYIDLKSKENKTND